MKPYDLLRSISIHRVRLIPRSSSDRALTLYRHVAAYSSVSQTNGPDGVSMLLLGLAADSAQGEPLE
jgi:hypothetical protein